MSMLGNFVAITSQQLEEYLLNPDPIKFIVYPEDINAVKPKYYLEIDKAWHAIHFILNDSQYEGRDPLCYAIFGKQTIGGNVGYGPARYLTSDEVLSIAKALSEVTPEVFSRKFSMESLKKADIYPEFWWEQEAETDLYLHYVLSRYIKVREFYASAAERDDAMLLFLN